MASDLISRSALIEAMNASKRQPTSDENIEGYCEGWNDLADIINSQPTAYNVDVVVDTVREACYSMGFDESQTEIIVNDVRKGGVNDNDR